MQYFKSLVLLVFIGAVGFGNIFVFDIFFNLFGLERIFPEESRQYAALYWMMTVGLFLTYLIAKIFLKFYTLRYFAMNILVGICFGIVGYIWYTNFKRIPNGIYNLFSILVIIIQYIIGFFTFHFYRMKAENDESKLGTIWSDMEVLVGKVNYMKSGFSSLGMYKDSPPSNIIEMIPVGASSESTELMTLLSKVDISNIDSIEFYPSGSQGFIIKTPNIKRLAVYMTSKLGKTTFAPEELRIQFDYIVKNIQSDLSKTDFNAVQGKISELVTRGGEVRINQIKML